MILQILPIFPLLWVLVTLFGPPRGWEKSRFTLTERLLFRAALGLGILSYLILGLGLLGALNRTALGILIGVFILISLPGGWALARELMERLTQRSKARAGGTKDAGGVSRKSGGSTSIASWVQAMLAVEMSLLILLMLFGCASPPTGGDWDGLSYHLADPKIYLQAGRIFPLPWEHHSNFPFLVEMLFTLGLAFGSVALAKAFHFAMALLTAGALTAAYHRLFRTRGHGDSETESGAPAQERLSLLPAALFLSAPLVFWEATVAYVDLGSTLYAFLAIYAFMVAMEGRGTSSSADVPPIESAGDSAGAHPAWLVLAGVMTGFAIGSKTTNGIFLLLLALGWLWRRRDRGFRWRGVGVFALCYALPALLIAAPWFLKSYLWTGNPVYPFFYGIFGGRGWNADLARTYDIEQAQFGLGRTPAAILLLPWNLTFHPASFSKGIGAFASLGAFALAYLPLLSISRPLPRWVKAGLWLTLGFLAVWVGLTQQIRYLLPLLPVLCLLSAYAAERASLNRWGKVAVGGFAAGSLLLILLMGFPYVQPMIPVALGAVSENTYLDSAPFELWPACRYINENLPRNAKVLLIEETRGFYLDREYMWGNPGHHALIPWDTFRTPEEMAAWMRKNGFTHLLLNTRWMRKGWGSAPWEALIARGASGGTLRLAFSDRGVELFEFPP